MVLTLQLYAITLAARPTLLIHRDTSVICTLGSQMIKEGLDTVYLHTTT
jgi:hypothetical protein